MNAANITETEWELMRIIWAKHPITSTAIVHDLVANDPSWHPKTARALLARLVKRGSLRFSAESRRYVYTPLISERQALAAASETFLERVLGGSLKPMLTYFVEQKQITRADLKELSDLLESRKSSAKPVN